MRIVLLAFAQDSGSNHKPLHSAASVHSACTLHCSQTTHHLVSLWCCDRTAFLLSFTAASSFTRFPSYRSFASCRKELALSLSLSLFLLWILAHKGNAITRMRWDHTEMSGNVERHITHAFPAKTKILCLFYISCLHRALCNLSW